MLHFAPIWDFAWIPFVPVLPSEFSEALSAGEVVAKNMYNIGQLTKTVNEIVVKLQNLTGVPGVFTVSRVKDVPGGDVPNQQRVFEKGGASGIWVTNLTEVELVRAWIKDDNNNNHLFADSAGKTIENGLIFVIDQKDDDWQFMILTTDGKLYTTKGKYSEMPNDESKVKMTDVPDLTQLKADVETLKSEMATAKQDIVNLKSDMSTAKQDITKLKSDVSSANQNITSLQSTVQNIQQTTTQTGTDVSGLTQSLNSLTSTVTQHTADLEGIKKNTLDKITRWTNLETQHTNKFRDNGVSVNPKGSGNPEKGVFLATTGEVFNGTDYHSFEYNLALPIRSSNTIKVVGANGEDSLTPVEDGTGAKYVTFELPESYKNLPSQLAQIQTTLNKLPVIQTGHEKFDSISVGATRQDHVVTFPKAFTSTPRVAISWYGSHYDATEPTPPSPEDRSFGCVIVDAHSITNTGFKLSAGLIEDSATSISVAYVYVDWIAIEEKE